MRDFSFSVPQDVVFGKGSLNKIPEMVKKLGSRKVFIISGPNLFKMGTVKKITDILDTAEIPYDIFTDVEANPSTKTVSVCTEAFIASGADSIIAFGGGSPMDVAKAVGITAKYGGSISEYEGAHKVPGKIFPLIAIPTTAGTGSEVTAFTVITDKSRNYKLTVFSYELIPSYAVLDPELIMSLPASIAAATGVDALVHAIEAYLSKISSPFSDALAEKAIELIGKNIRLFTADRGNEAAASAMLNGSMLAGIAFAWARLGNVHAMAHPVSGYFGTAHGVANAILLPVVLEYNALADEGRYEKIYNLIKGVSSEKCFEPSMLVEEIRELTKSLGIPQTLSEVGVTEDKIPEMAVDAMKSGNIAVNPRQSTIKDIEALFRKAL